MNCKEINKSTLRFQRRFHKKIIFRMLDRRGIFAFSFPIKISALKENHIFQNRQTHLVTFTSGYISSQVKKILFLKSY